MLAVCTAGCAAVVVTTSLALPAGAANTAPVNTSLPAVSDTTPHDGDVLTGYRGGWTGLNPVTFTFAWERCDQAGSSCTPVAGAAGSTYAVTPDDIGSTLVVHVTASNSLGTTSADSLATAVVGPRPRQPVAAHDLRRTHVRQRTDRFGGRLVGNGSDHVRVRWKRCDPTGVTCTSITGATAGSYTVVLADAGATLRLAVTATNAGGSSSATSVATAPVGRRSPRSTSRSPSVSDVHPARP